MSYSYPTVGAFYHNHACTFTVWAPTPGKVDLLIEGKLHSLKMDERGFWSATLRNVNPGAKYVYVLDDEKKLPDPASRLQTDGVHGHSSVVDPVYTWNDHAWKGIQLGNMIIYELHVGTFTSTSDFNGVISRLDYLNELGVNAIELLPVAQFPGSRNWGYDGVFPFAVQDSYGGPAGLKALVDAAHAKGIAIILDVVYNHLGPEGNYLGEYAPYFTDKHKTGWGKALNFDDAYCDGVRHYFWQNALMWLDEFHIDGLRLDAVHAIWDFSAKHFIDELSQKVQALEAKSGRKKVLVAEFDLNNPRYINPHPQGGYALDGQWIDEYHHALHSVVTGEVDGYYEDFGTVDHLVRSLRDSYVYTGQYSKHRKKHFGIAPKDNSYDQFVVFAQNHDQVGNRMPGDRITHHLTFEGLKMTAAAYILSPHVPMLFMGEEYGEKNPFQYFISHTDKDLVEAVRKGRKAEFSYFNWEGEVPDPQAEETFRACILSWDYGNNNEQQTLLNFYKEIIAVKREHPAFQDFARDTVTANVLNGRKAVTMEKRGGGRTLLLIINFEKSQIDYLAPGRYNVLVDSASEKWRGPGAVEVQNGKLIVQPESALLLEIK